MWSARQTWKMGRRAAGFLGGLLATTLLVAAPAAAALPWTRSNVSDSAPVPSGSPAIAVNKAGRVFVAWKEGPDPGDGTTKILYRRSGPTQGSCGGGLKFDAPLILWSGTVEPSRPALAANDTEVFVAWQASSAVLFRRSTGEGQTFDPAITLGPTNSNSSRFNVPSVAADNTGVFVAWSNGSFNGFLPAAEILLAKSTSLGGGFEPAQPVSGTATHSWAPSLVTDGSNIFLAWEEWGSGALGFLTSSIVHKKFRRTDALAGVAGMFPTNLSSVLFPTGAGRAFGPNVAFRDGFLSVVFGTSNGPSFYHRLGTSTVDGMSFSDPVDVSGTMSGLSPSDARVARGNDGALVAWAQKLGLTDADTEIQYWLGGATTEQGSVSATLGARSVNPATAIDASGRLLVAWQEAVNGSDEIYVGYRGGTAADKPNAWVEMTPQTLNAKTIEKGVGVFTLRIGFLDGSAVNYPDSLVLNGVDLFGPAGSVPPRSSLVDTDGDGKPDTLELKIERSKLQPVLDGATLTTAQRNGNDPVKYTVKGNMTDVGCFSSGPGDVRIIHQ